MKWMRISLTEDERKVVMSERESYPDPLVRRKLWAIWLLHCGTTREKTAEIVGVARSTIERYVGEFREGDSMGFGNVVPDISRPANSPSMPRSFARFLKTSQRGPLPKPASESRTVPA